MHKFTLFVLLSMFLALTNAQPAENSNGKLKEFFLPENASFFSMPFLDFGVDKIQTLKSISKVLEIPVNQMLLVNYPELGYTRGSDFANEKKNRFISRAIDYRIKNIKSFHNRAVDEICEPEKNIFLFTNCVVFGIVDELKNLSINDSSLPSKGEYEKSEEFNNKIKQIKDKFINDNIIKPDLDIYRRVGNNYNENGIVDYKFKASEIIRGLNFKQNYDVDTSTTTIEFESGLSYKFLQNIEDNKKFKLNFRNNPSLVMFAFYVSEDSNVHLKSMINKKTGELFTLPTDFIMATGVGLNNYSILKLKNLEEKKRVELELKEINEREKKHQEVEIESKKKEREKPENILKMAYANHIVIANYCQGQVTSNVLQAANSHIKKIENRLIPKLQKGQSKENLQLYASSVAKTTVEFGSVMGGQQFYCPVSFKNLEDYSKNLK